MGEERKNHVTGEISLKSPILVEWKIQDSSLLRRSSYLESPSFSFSDGIWCLKYCGNLGIFSTISITLKLKQSSRNYSLTFTLGIKGENSLHLSATRSAYFNSSGYIGETCFKLPTQYLRNLQILRQSQGEITIFCKLPPNESTEEASQSMQSKGLEVSTDGGPGYLTEEDSKQHKAALEFTSERGIKKLSENLKDFLLKEEHTDVLVRVKERQFKAHKVILAARSNVFSAMFTHDTIEKKTHAVEITDCEPDAFQHFLTYLYSGKLEKVLKNQVFDLYLIADKYKVQELKEECIKYMKDLLNAETFYDVMSLALRHKETELIQSATDYFIENAKKIILTVNWLSFVKENPVEANELFIKRLVSGISN